MCQCTSSQESSSLSKHVSAEGLTGHRRIRNDPDRQTTESFHPGCDRVRDHKKPREARSNHESPKAKGQAPHLRTSISARKHHRRRAREAHRLSMRAKRSGWRQRNRRPSSAGCKRRYSPDDHLFRRAYSGGHHLAIFGLLSARRKLRRRERYTRGERCAGVPRLPQTAHQLCGSIATNVRHGRKIKEASSFSKCRKQEQRARHWRELHCTAAEDILRKHDP